MNDPSNNWFRSRSDPEKIAFLAWLSHDLTIHGRAFGLDLDGNQAVRAFRGLNELQHKISQNIGHLSEGTNRYGGELIWQILHETAANYGLSAHLQTSLKNLAARHGR
jgi:hypothetical protein